MAKIKLVATKGYTYAGIWRNPGDVFNALGANDAKALTLLKKAERAPKDAKITRNPAPYGASPDPEDLQKNEGTQDNQESPEDQKTSEDQVPIENKNDEKESGPDNTDTPPDPDSADTSDDQDGEKEDKGRNEDSNKLTRKVLTSKDLTKK